MGAVPLEGLRVVQGKELLSVYRFNTKTAEHFFCGRCGIYTHHRRRSKPNQYGYNVGCLRVFSRCLSKVSPSTRSQSSRGPAT